MAHGGSCMGLLHCCPELVVQIQYGLDFLYYQLRFPPSRWQNYWQQFSFCYTGHLSAHLMFKDKAYYSCYHGGFNGKTQMQV